MSRRFVVLATDATTPAYAVWAPVVGRAWRLIGWEPLYVLHTDGWESTWGREIRREIDEIAAVTLTVPTCAPLGMPNTMRCSRLIAAAAQELADDDVLMTTDVDMVPVSRSFFVPPAGASAFVLRCLYQARLCERPVTAGPFDVGGVDPGQFRFAMCYIGALVATWRQLFPEIKIGDAGASLTPVVAGRTDHPEHDEGILSFRLLSAWPGPTVKECWGQWRRGGLLMTDPVDLPCLSALYPNLPPGLALHGEGGCGKGTPAPGCVDWIPGRFEAGSRPWTDVEAVGAFHPELGEWVKDYVRKIRGLL